MRESDWYLSAAAAGFLALRVLPIGHRRSASAQQAVAEAKASGTSFGAVERIAAQE